MYWNIKFLFFLLKNSSVKNASSITSYIDIVNEETHDGTVFEGHTLSVNNCDYSWITDDEETDGSYFGENTLYSRSAVKMETCR